MFSNYTAILIRASADDDYFMPSVMMIMAVGVIGDGILTVCVCVCACLNSN